MKTGIELFAKERLEQVSKHGRTTEKDVEINRNYELAEAGRNLVWIEEEEKCHEPSTWDADIWKKMNEKPYLERLVIAGALLAAELDRMAVVDPEGYRKLCEKYGV